MYKHTKTEIEKKIEKIKSSPLYPNNTPSLNKKQKQNKKKQKKNTDPKVDHHTGSKC